MGNTQREELLMPRGQEKSFQDKVTSERRLEGSKAEGEGIQVEGIPSAKPSRQEHTWQVEGRQ
jgi:hypothetical protein